MQNQSACIGPRHGPMQAKKGRNACKGPENGPVRAPKDNRPSHCTNLESKYLRSEATSPAGERRLLPPSPSPEGRDLGEGVTVNRRSPSILERENPAVKAGLFRVYGQRDNYRTNYDDYLDVYLFGIQSDN